MWSPKIQRLRNVVLRKEAKALLDAIEKVAEEAHTPTDEMVAEAKRGLEWRRKFNRGGTEVGVARARDISNKKSLPVATLKRMHSYFARHEVDKDGEGFYESDKGFPSAGRIAWALWGGDAGRAWVNGLLGHHDKDSAVNIVDGDDNLRAPSTRDEATDAATGGSPGNGGESKDKVNVYEPAQVFRNAKLDKVSRSLVAAFDKLAAANSIIKLVGLQPELAEKISAHAAEMGNKSADVALARYFKAWTKSNPGRSWEDFLSNADQNVVRALVGDNNIAKSVAQLGGKVSIEEINSMIGGAVRQYSNINSEDKDALIAGFASKYSLPNEIVSSLYDDKANKLGNEAVVKMFKVWADSWISDGKLKISTTSLKDNLGRNLLNAFRGNMESLTRDRKLSKWFNNVVDYTDGKSIVDYTRFSDASASKILKTNYSSNDNIISDVEEESRPVQRMFEDAAHVAAREYSVKKFDEEAKHPLIKFNDGTYWVKVQNKQNNEGSNSCPHEAYAMGHCGVGSGSIYSLRSKANRPIATVEIDDRRRQIVQARSARNNMMTPLAVSKLGALYNAGLALYFNDKHASSLKGNTYEYLSLINNMMPVDPSLMDGSYVYEKFAQNAKDQLDRDLLVELSHIVSSGERDGIIFKSVERNPLGESDVDIKKLYYKVLSESGILGNYYQMAKDYVLAHLDSSYSAAYDKIDGGEVKKSVGYVLTELQRKVSSVQNIESAERKRILEKYVAPIINLADSNNGDHTSVMVLGKDLVNSAVNELLGDNQGDADSHSAVRDQIIRANEFIDSGNADVVGTVIEENVKPILEQTSKLVQQQLPNPPNGIMIGGEGAEQHAPPGEAILDNPDWALDPQYGLVGPDQRVEVDAINHIVNIGAGDYYDQLAEFVANGQIRVADILNMTLDDIRNLIDNSDDEQHVPDDRVASSIVRAYKKLSSRGQSISDLTQSGRGSRPFSGPLDESLAGDPSAKIGTEKDSKVNAPYTNNSGHDSERFDDEMNIVKGADEDKTAVGIPDQGVDENKYGQDYGRADMAIPRPHHTERMKYRK